METSDETQDTVISFLAKCGKETVSVVDSPGFIIHRLYLPMINEAFFALEAFLATTEDIDRSCLKALGFSLGPIAVADAIGPDILLTYMRSFRKDLVKNTDLHRFSFNGLRRKDSGERHVKGCIIIGNKSK